MNGGIRVSCQQSLSLSQCRDRALEEKMGEGERDGRARPWRGDNKRARRPEKKGKEENTATAHSIVCNATLSSSDVAAVIQSVPADFDNTSHLSKLVPCARHNGDRVHVCR